MKERHRSLKRRVCEVRNRWRRLILLKGISVTLLSTVAVFLAAYVLDSTFELSDVLRFLFLIALVTVFFLVLYSTVIRPLLRTPTEPQLARYLEEKHPDLEDRLVTAVELGDAPSSLVSPQILERLLEDARLHIEPLNLQKAVQARRPLLLGAAAMAATLLLGTLIFHDFSAFSLKLDRIFTPWKFPTVKPRPSLSVQPGDARVPAGSAQQVLAEVNGFSAEHVSLYFSERAGWEKVEMEATSEPGVYVYDFFDLNQDTRYYVKADDKLSEIFAFRVYTAPKIKRVDVIYTYPEYTGLKPRREIDGGDIWAPEGTKVTIRAVADKPLASAQVRLGEKQKLRTVVRADTLLTASFDVTRDTYYAIEVTDIDNLTNSPPPEFYVHALADQPPTLSVEWPGRDVKATMVEEVPIRIRIQDDYSKPSVTLAYTVNGEAEKRVPLRLHPVAPNRDDEEPGVEFTAEHLFYLEDLHVVPGDFLTYHLEASEQRGAGKEESVISEIYLVEVRPFELEFYRPLSQGQMSGRAGMSGGLSKMQWEILVATWKTLEKKGKIPAEELQGNTETILESQKNLREITQSFLFQMQQRSILTRQSSGDVAKFYSDALDAMQRAIEKLDAGLLREALQPEREALKNLRHAEGQVRKIQLQQAQGGSQAQNASMEELSRLFDDELKRLNNKYETLRQSQPQNTDEKVNEALEKVKELARRQQQFNRQMRDLARKKMPEEEKKRRIQELRRQQEELRRETQELAQQMRNSLQQNGGLPRRIQNDLRRATSEMNRASNNLKRQDTDLASAKGTQALNRLRQLEDVLRRNQKESLRRRLESVQKEVEQLAEAQKRLTEKVQRLSEKKQPSSEQLSGALRDQNDIGDNLAELQKDLDALVNQARRSRNRSFRQLQELKKDMERAGLRDKVARAESLLEKQKLGSALQAERDIRKRLEEMGEKVTQARSALAETDEEKLDLALDQTRRLRDRLENLQRQQGQEKAGEQGRRPEGRQQGAASNARNLQAGPSESQSAPRTRPEDSRRLNEDLNRTLDNLEQLQQSLQNDPSLAQDANRINQNLQNILRTFRGGDPARFSLVEQMVLVPLRNLEAELAQKLELLKNKEKMFLARDEQVPEEYKELVQKYYEALSRSQQGK